MQRQTTPYNTGKVKIGLAYEPKRNHRPTDEEHLIQDALLGLFDNKEERQLKRYVGLVVFICLTALVVAYAPR
jgi:hypothetical protein